MKNTATPYRTNVKNAKVLFVEDNDDQWLLMQQMMRTSLQDVTSVRVASFQQAVSLLEEWRYQEWEMPKLILLDLYLPTAEEGLALLKYIKAMEGFMRLIPVVMLTNSTEGADIAQAYQLGVSAYLLKPVDMAGWQPCFELLRSYWWETATLPTIQFGL